MGETPRIRSGWMTALFCYNRPDMLRNALNSIALFDSSEKIGVFDDASDHPEQVRLLEQVASRERFSVFVRDDPTDRSERRGGLHPNLNHAIEVARAEGFSYINLIQDDMQFVCQTWETYGSTEHLLEESNLHSFQIHLGFHKYLGPRWLPVDDHKCYAHSALAMAHTGALQLNHAEVKLPLFPPNDENASELAASKPYVLKGYSLLGIKNPCLCYVPWPEKFEYGNLQQSSVRRGLVGDLLVRPLTARQVRSLRDAPLQTIPLHEDYVRPVGWCCLYPYEYAPTPLRSWLRKNWYKWRGGEFRMRYLPRVVGACTRLGPAFRAPRRT